MIMFLLVFKKKCSTDKIVHELNGKLLERFHKFVCSINNCRKLAN